MERRCIKMKSQRKTKVDNSVLELLELANLNSPFTSQLVNKYCLRLTRKMLRSGKIDNNTARDLCPDHHFETGARESKYFLVN